MAKKTVGRPRSNVETVPVKIRKEAYHLLRTIASWKDMSALDYLSAIVEEATARDLVAVQKEMAEAAKEAKK